VGLAILEILSVHPTSPAALRASAKNLVEGYQNLMAAVKPHGMRVFQQLWHGGHHAIPMDGSLPLSASDIPSVTEGVVPQPMTDGEIQDIVHASANAARLCEAGGLDGVELHGAHGYLIEQFMAPLTNKRTDEYGGSFENRIRFKLEVLRAIRGRKRIMRIRVFYQKKPRTQVRFDRKAVIASWISSFSLPEYRGEK